MENALTKPLVEFDDEHYMCARQLIYFQDKLLSWRTELTESNRYALVCLGDQDGLPIEDAERSAKVFDRELLIKTHARNWALIQSIDQALSRIKDRTYGYCLATEEPIGFARLDANPVALYCLIVQEALEKKSNFSVARNNL